MKPDALGHEPDDFYMCRHCGKPCFEAERAGLVCPGSGVEPLIVDESQGMQVVGVHYERGDDDGPP